MSQQTTYPLQVGTIGEQRLAILNELYNPITQQFLIDNGLQPGMTVLEVGCGTGIMACWLAQQVGPTGKVIAIDQSAEQIAVSQQLAKDKGLTNIQFMTLSVENLSQLNEHFDLAFARWTLCFVPQPLQGVKAMHELLKPNGILVIDDLNIGDLGCFIYPVNKIMERWMALWTGIFKATGKDLYFIDHLLEYLQKLNCHALKIHFSQPALTTARTKSVAPLGAKELRNTAVSCGSMTALEIDTLITDLEKLASQANVIGFIRTVLIGCRK